MKINTISFTRRRLPHWCVAGKSYFVTFRLRGSLPLQVIQDLREKREKIQQMASEKDKHKFEQFEFKIIENILDSVNNNDNAFLCRDNIATILMERFSFLEEKYCWQFPAYVIMPNHIHCMCIDNTEGVNISLTRLIGEFKRYTSRKINMILGHSGRVWVDENFDHWCRTTDEEAKIIEYIANNPVKAGLVAKKEDWKWGKY